MAELESLQKIIRRYSSAVIAFSGGVDSTFLSAVAKSVLGDRLLLVTATSSTYPIYELELSKESALRLGIEHLIIESEELNITGFAENTPQRCFFCKSELFGKISEIASQRGMDVVFDGSNADDLCDYRPGMVAKEKFGVVSPLIEAGFTKEDIRNHSRQMGLPTAGKGSFACLASRFPYGESITLQKLQRVGEAEAAIRNLGFNQFRVRSHGDLARIEIDEKELSGAWARRKEFTKICRKAGYTWVSLDCEGYRTGAMNEAISVAIDVNVNINPASGGNKNEQNI